MMDYLVNIALITYNHENYIAQAIESVLSQLTDFNYRLIIGEDCSSDNTFEICDSYQKKFPEKILLIKSKANVGLVLNYRLVFDACTAKYIAILEGDDYWTDPLKLQKQVDLLESDIDIGLVHTNFDKLYENGKIVCSFKNRSSVKTVDGYVFNKLIKENFITSITACFRRDLFERYVDYNEFIKEKLFTIDYSIWLELSFHSKVKYIDQSMAVYRVLNTSLTNSDEFIKKELYYNKGRGIKKYYVNKYSPDMLSIKKVDKVYDTGLLIWAIKLNNREKAIEYLGKAVKKKFPAVFLKPFINNTMLFKILVACFNTKLRSRAVFRNNSIREFLNFR